MAEEYTISYDDEPQKATWGIIGRGVSEHNTQQAGDDTGRLLCFALHAPDDEIVGGVIGSTYWDWFQLDLMWVKEELRGQGYGHRLLTLAEEEARKRGAKNAFLDTFTFQAPDFYKQHGYEVFGELPDFPDGYRRFYMKKQL